MKRLRFYFPGGRVADTLAEALAFDESFIAATDDHELVYLVEWAEMDDDDRAPLREIARLPDEAVYDTFVAEVLTEMDDEQRAMCFAGDQRTLIAWTTGESENGDRRVRLDDVRRTIRGAVSQIAGHPEVGDDDLEAMAALREFADLLLARIEALP